MVYGFDLNGNQDLSESVCDYEQLDLFLSKITFKFESKSILAGDLNNFL